MPSIRPGGFFRSDRETPLPPWSCRQNLSRRFGRGVNRFLRNQLALLPWHSLTGVLPGLAAGGLTSEPTGPSFRTSYPVQHPVGSPVGLLHWTKGPSDVGSSVRLRRRRLASPVLPLRRPTGPASNACLRRSRQLPCKSYRNPFSRSDPPSSASQPMNDSQPPLSAVAILPHPTCIGSVALIDRGASGAYRWGADFRTLRSGVRGLPTLIHRCA